MQRQNFNFINELAVVTLPVFIILYRYRVCVYKLIQSGNQSVLQIRTYLFEFSDPESLLEALLRNLSGPNINFRLHF
jgi:hypothetical protein